MAPGRPLPLASLRPHRRAVEAGLTERRAVLVGGGRQPAQDLIAGLRRRTACDLWYIENRSPWLDLRILLAMPLALFDTRHAY